MRINVVFAAMISIICAHMAWAQSQLTGVVKGLQNKPVAGATVTLRSTIGNVDFTDQTNKHGLFTVPVDWSIVDSLNTKGAIWKLFVVAPGYRLAKFNMYLDRNIIRPSSINVDLQSAPDEHEDDLASCSIKRYSIVPLYMFQFRAAPEDQIRSEEFMNNLVYVLKRNVLSTLGESLMGDKQLVPHICEKVLVTSLSTAEKCVAQLDAHAALWGFMVVSGSDSYLQPTVCLTWKLDIPQSTLLQLKISGRLSEIADPKSQVYRSTKVFVALAVGIAHLKSKAADLPRALRCFDLIITEARRSKSRIPQEIVEFARSQIKTIQVRMRIDKISGSR